jgi:hypothetical protein
MALFEQTFKNFLSTMRYPTDVKYHISGLDMIDMIVRIDKRKAYYQFFHGMDINELKVAGIYVYWILKLKPFSITDRRYAGKLECCDVNEVFALYIIVTVLLGLGRLDRLIQGSEPYFKELRYSFRFRHFSIDAMLVLVEALNTKSFFS